MSGRDQAPQPPGNVLKHLSELEAEGYHIAYCTHARTDAGLRQAAWKTLDSTDFKVVLVGCVLCYMRELSTAVRAAVAISGWPNGGWPNG